MQILSFTPSVVFSACVWLVCLSGCGGGGADGQAQVNSGTYSSLSVDSLSSEVAQLELKSFNTSASANSPSDTMLQAAGLSSVNAMLDTVTQASGSAVAKVIIKNFSEGNLYVRSDTVYGVQDQKFEYRVSALSQLMSVNFSLDNNAPAGLGIDAQSGLLTWLAPVAGDYSFNVIAKGAGTNSSASGTIHMIIRAANQQIGPDISFTPITGQTGSPINAFVGISDPGAQQIKVDISGAPAGMSYSASGPGIMLRWRRPVPGSYSLVITARDSQGLSKQVTVPVKVN
jgi:hypothetical protein